MQEVTSISKYAFSLSLPVSIGRNNLGSVRKKYLTIQHVGRQKAFPHPVCPLSNLMVLPGVKGETIVFPLRLKQRGFALGSCHLNHCL